MYTITKTSPSAVSRKLSAMNFERSTQDSKIGFVAYEAEASDGYGTVVSVVHYGYDNGHRSSIAEEFAAAGYYIENLIDNVAHNGLVMTAFDVVGKTKYVG